MKPVRVLVIALLGYAAVLVPSVSQAHGVELSLPGINVRLPAPPIPILLPPGVSIREERGYDYGYEYRRMPPPPPRYYREDWRRERWERHHDRYDHDYDRHHGGWDHDRDGWRR